MYKANTFIFQKKQASEEEQSDIIFCLLNVQGLVGKRYNKHDSDEMKQLFKDHDVLLFTETWSSDCYNYNVLNFQSCVVNRTCTSEGAKRNSGGMIVYVHERLKKYVHFVKSSCESVLWLRFDKCLFNIETDVLLCLTYNVPKGSTR